MQVPNKPVIGTQVPDKQLKMWMQMPKIVGRRRISLPHKSSEIVEITQIHKTIKVLTMWTNYCDIPVTLEENA